MTALKVIGIILLIFILIGFLRVGALMQFGDELRVQLSVGPFRFTLLPAKEKKETPKKKAKEKKPKSEGEEAKQKKKPSLPKPTKEELRDLITTALSALKETAKRTCKRLRIDPLEILIVFGGTDPADIAQTYGYASAAMWGVMPHLEDLFHIPDPSLHLRMDYSSEKTHAEGAVGLSLRIRDGLHISLALLIPMLNGTCAIKRRIKTTLPRKNQRRALRKTVNTVKN